MANLNRIILVGRLTADPLTNKTVEGLAISRFSLAVSRPAAGQTEAVDFIDIVAWNKLAEICNQYLKKGGLALVEGRIQNRSFEDQSGQRKWVTEVVAKNITRLDKPLVGSQESKNETALNEEFIDDKELTSDLPF